MIEITKKNNKKICLIDPLSPYGHKDVNKVLVEQLNLCGDLTVLCSKSLLDEKIKNVKYVLFNDIFFEITKNSMYNRIKLLYVLYKMCKYLKKEKFDMVLFSSYEVLTLYLVSLFFPCIFKKYSGRIYILNHSNIDDIERSKIKQFAYKGLSSSVVNICYEQFIGEHIEYKYNKKWIRVKHNISNYKLKYDNKKICKDISEFFDMKDIIYIVFPGFISHSEIVFEQIRELDSKNILESRKIKVFMKNNVIRYQSSNVMIYNNYLTENEYSYIFDKCNYIGILYNNEYVYRVSGIYFDAVTFKKPIIYYPTSFFKLQEKRFGDIGIKYTGNIYDTIISINEEKYVYECNNIYQVNKYYSDERLREDLKEL